MQKHLACVLFLAVFIGFRENTLGRESSIFFNSDFDFLEFAQLSEDIPESAILSEPTNNLAELSAKALKRGKIRVIVRLGNSAEPANFRPEGNLNAFEKRAQRAAIRATGNTFLQKLEGFQISGVKRFRYVPYISLEVDFDTLSAIVNFPEVLSVVEDKIVAPTLQTSLSLINAPQAWASGFTGAGQTIAILDTGIDKSHDFLAGKVISEACYSTFSDFVSSSLCPDGVAQTTAPDSGLNCPPTVRNCHHGTHIAGIAAGKNISQNRFGTAKDATLISIQVYSRFTADFCGGSLDCALSYTSDQMRGLERIYELRNTYQIAAVNLSLGVGAYFSNCDSDALKPAIDNLASVGIATIISSGNNGYTNALNSPACISSAISVAATETSGAMVNTVAGFSNRANFLTLFAPGRSIVSSLPGNIYAGLSGTSTAAAHVSGAWAILKQKVPSASVSTVNNALVSTGAATAIEEIVKPRIRIDAALNALASPTAATVTVKGKVFSADGAGIAKVRITLTDTATGEIYQTASGSFGNYTLQEIPVGANYIVQANHKTYRFTPQTISLFESNENLNLIAEP